MNSEPIGSTVVYTTLVTIVAASAAVFVRPEELVNLYGGPWLAMGFGIILVRILFVVRLSIGRLKEELSE